MRDLLGNELSKGNLIYWTGGKVMAHVIDIEEPTVTGNDGPAYVTVAVRFPVFRQRGEPGYLIDSFIRPIDPSAQEALENLGKGPGPKIFKPS